MIQQLARDWILAVIAGLGVMGLFIFAWSWAYSEYADPILTENDVTIPSYVFPGDTFKLCRKLTFHRDVSVQINRWMVGKVGTVEVNYALPTVRVSREKGTIDQCRFIEVPKQILPGQYKLHTSIEYTSWPWWHNVRELPCLDLTILEPLWTTQTEQTTR